jgi:adenylate kinase
MRLVIIVAGRQACERMASKRLMFLGAPGVGKGTYAGRIAPKLGIPTISTGDLIRAEMKTASSLGKEFASYANKGQLVPDELVMKIVQNRLQKVDCKSGYLLDGFPRTIRQAEALEKFSALNLVVNIELKEEYLMEKIMGRRVCPNCNKNFNIAHITNEKVSSFHNKKRGGVKRLIVRLFIYKNIGGRGNASVAAKAR